LFVAVAVEEDIQLDGAAVGVSKLLAAVA